MDASAELESREPPSDEDEDGSLFGTATMAELCARQGRLGQAVAIYRRLIAAGGEAGQLAAWTERLGALERVHGGAAAPPEPAAARPPARPPAKPPAAEAAPPRHQLALVVRQPVRGGQVVHARGNDVVVLAPVNPGGQVVADGHVHVYAPLRGRAIAGAGGCPDARIFCLRLEAELLAINGLYLTAEQIPAAAWGRAAQVYLQDGRWMFAPL
jgi:septum site-determining protein MinC